MRYLLVVLLCVAAEAVGGSSDTSFVPGAAYDPRIPSPDSILGYALGSRPARYDEIVSYLQTLARHSGRVQLTTTGTTHEGRAAYLLVISSEENHDRLEEIKRDIRRLTDPRGMPDAEASALLSRLPAIVWIGYGIHGDEISSGDAALQVAYYLAAGTDSVVTGILRDVVVLIDPMQNPDGRERFLGQMQQWRGNVQSGDIQSLHHTGTWPPGRGNHYLFDLNRDWFALVHPETRARVRVLLDWNPQVVIDSHEMGPHDTYLFSPPREPINPNIDQSARKWWGIFAADQARAFDRYGWSYYTREWNDEWYPGYGASWCLYAGGLGILYEQAGVEGSFVKRPDGTTLTYREAVHHHTVSSLANLGTAALHHEELLGDYTALRRGALDLQGEDIRVFYVLPGNAPARCTHLAEILTLQGIDVRVAEREFSATNLTDGWGKKHRSRKLPPGTLIVSLDQSLGRLARAILEFDPRLKTEVVNAERRQLEREGQSRMYDITGWSLPIAYGLEAYASTDPARVTASRFDTPPPAAGGVAGPAKAYGYMLDYGDDPSVVALARMLQEGLRVRVARDTGNVDGRAFRRGSLLLRATENPPNLRQVLERICASTGARAQAVTTALATRGVDLGGNDFVLLQEPRIALVGGPEVSSTSFGSLWHLLDDRMRMRHTLLGTQFLTSGDLRKYNVLVLPEGSEGGYRRLLGKEGIGRLRRWVEEGGTLIAVGGAASFVADSATGLTSVRLRHQALRDVGLFMDAQRLEERAVAPRIDSVALWSGSLSPDTVSIPGRPEDEKLLAQEDERRRLFSPQGTIMKILPDPEHWLCYGAGEALGAVMAGSSAYLSRWPVSTAVRFAGNSELRVAGLLWPEARERWAHTAYLTSERRGNGQVILFAQDPAFRGFFLGTEQLLLNAMLLGPGCGARAAAPW